MTYVEFFWGSYFLAWCSLWLWWAIVPMVFTLYQLARNILRVITIFVRGWPPAHLDADGDFLVSDDQ